ncbi:uncharacterized protein LOC111033342 [Myzus persicae]|uniref:uncharacterized protein LOC111033342 n=1 Tax=Myzus persicae TaxID=13164 RepID=UPI000B93720B|nr:uncharacterized protein LOC111033342 [Myzus persicae]
MTRPPTAVLFLLSCVISMSPGPRFTVVTASWVGHPESPYANRMALFKHVLLNDAQWSPVLKQKVKLSGLSLPKYRRTEFNGKVLDQIQLVAKDDGQNLTAMTVLQTLMDKTPWSGTNVNYTAYVLSTSVMCFTYNNVRFLLSQVIDRVGMLARKIWKTDINKDDTKDKKEEEEEDKSSDVKSQDPVDEGIEDKVDDALEDLRMTLGILVDKVAAVDGELAFFTTGLYDLDGAEKTDFGIFDVFEMMRTEVNERLERHCHITPIEDVYEYLSKYETLNVSPTPPGELTPNEDTLKLELNEFSKIIDSMIDVYDGLNVETLPMETWILILDYRLPISMNIKFYIDGYEKNTVEQTPKTEMSERLGEAIIKEGKKYKSGEQQKNVWRRRKKRIPRTMSNEL